MANTIERDAELPKEESDPNDESDTKEEKDEEADEAAEESFPASDPPAW